jgi:hypothetical protein
MVGIIVVEIADIRHSRHHCGGSSRHYYLLARKHQAIWLCGVRTVIFVLHKSLQIFLDQSMLLEKEQGLFTGKEIVEVADVAGIIVEVAGIRQSRTHAWNPIW